jgi:hypothetical protein
VPKWREINDTKTVEKVYVQTAGESEMKGISMVQLIPTITLYEIDMFESNL